MSWKLGTSDATRTDQAGPDHIDHIPVRMHSTSEDLNCITQRTLFEHIRIGQELIKDRQDGSGKCSISF